MAFFLSLHYFPVSLLILNSTERLRYSRYSSSRHIALPMSSESFATGLPLTYWSLITILSAFSSVSFEQNVPIPNDTFDLSQKYSWSFCALSKSRLSLNSRSLVLGSTPKLL